MPGEFGDADTDPVLWDLPTRLFHWSLVLLVAGLWWTGTARMFQWHALIGYTLATGLLFRLVWGVIGSSTARFSNFVRGPAAVMTYLRGNELDLPVGHSPLGGLSVVSLLALLVCQVIAGLFAVDIDGMQAGPFSYLISFELARSAAALHHLLFNILIGFIALHVAAIAFYHVFRGQNLVGPMITGKARTIGRATEAITPHWVALLVVIVIALLVWAAVQFLGRT
jgi:cytochrome b